MVVEQSMTGMRWLLKISSKSGWGKALRAAKASARL
jgi:hypothetical protein